MIVVTTSRRTTQRIRSFVKDLVSILPSSVKINRGHKSLLELAIEACKLGAKYFLVVTEWRGNPRAINIYEVEKTQPHHVEYKEIATILIRGVKLSRENPESSRAYGISRIGVDYSKCISDDCFYLADLLVKILQDKISEKPELKIVLEEDKFIVINALNIHEKPVGPVLRVEKVVRHGD